MTNKCTLPNVFFITHTWIWASKETWATKLTQYLALRKQQKDFLWKISFLFDYGIAFQVLFFWHLYINSVSIFWFIPSENNLFTHIHDNKFIGQVLWKNSLHHHISGKTPNVRWRRPTQQFILLHSRHSLCSAKSCWSLEMVVLHLHSRIMQMLLPKVTYCAFKLYI